MTKTFLIYASHNQKIKTKKGYNGYPIVYSNPDYYVTKKILAADFGLIEVGDYLIICSDSSFKYAAQVSSIEMLTDASGTEHDGLPVKVVFGKKAFNFPKISASVACTRLLDSGVKFPNLLSLQTRGFKQGAFAELLDTEQAEEIKQWRSKDDKHE